MTAINPRELFELRDLVLAYRDAKVGDLNATADAMRAAVKPLGWQHGCGTRPDNYAEAHLRSLGVYID